MCFVFQKESGKIWKLFADGMFRMVKFNIQKLVGTVKFMNYIEMT